MCAEGDSKMKVANGLFGKSSGVIAGVPKRRTHPPEMIKESLWQNDPKSWVPENPDWPVTDVRSSDEIDLEVDPFKATEKM